MGKTDTLILAHLRDRPQAAAPAIGAALRMMAAEVRARLVMLESMRFVISRQDMRIKPPIRGYIITNEGRRRVEAAFPRSQSPTSSA